MSASQGRLLSLTAKKNDVEFQGQMINQRRMELSSQTAGINAQLLTLAVPTTPPIGATAAEQTAYENAMATYNANYSAVIASLAPIQEQDKGLELQLKGLDTEQQAIQTEVDAVAKVIDKNIEVSFKTFG